MCCACVGLWATTFPAGNEGSRGQNFALGYPEQKKKGIVTQSTAKFAGALMKDELRNSHFLLVIVRVNLNGGRCGLDFSTGYSVTKYFIPKTYK